MNKNFRPFITTAICAVIIFLLTFYFYNIAGSSGFIISNCVLYAVLGVLIGRVWSVYPWQIGLIASLPGWIFTAWRFFARNEEIPDIALNVSLFYWHPILSMIASYVGTYFGRWLAFRQKKARSTDAEEKE